MSVAALEQGVAFPVGDPQALLAAAGKLLAAAAAMDGVAANLGASAEAACGGRRWVGPASNEFHHHVQRTRGAVGTGSHAFHDAATALTRLAGELQAAQEQARRAQAAADAASGAIGSASQGLALLGASAEPDPLARSRLQRTLDDATAELTGARAAIAQAAERARVAGRAAAAALQAATATATVPRAPEGVGACETTAGWLQRQAGDVFLDSSNPLAAEHGDYERWRIEFDLVSVGGIEAFKEFHKYAAERWVRYEPGYWARRPTVVRGYWKRSPKGRLFPVKSYPRPGVWVPAQEVPDIVKRMASARYARAGGIAGAVLTFGTAGLDQWVEDRDRPDLDAGERAERVVVASGVVGGVTLAGAAAGAAIGSAIVPGAGTVVGAIVGSVIGSGAGHAVGVKVKEWWFF
jgi:hypothetical protein